MARTALITGVTGQDGSYLAEQLLDEGYAVHGVVRRSSSGNTQRIEHLIAPDAPRVTLHDADMTDLGGLLRILDAVQPDEVYNLAAQSDVAISFRVPESTTDITGVGALRLLEAVRLSGATPRFYQASTSEMFGDAPAPQHEDTPFHPRSPYAVAKLFAHHMTALYRDAYGLFTCSGILFNHESPRRGTNFVSRHVTRGVARIVAGAADALPLGNLDSRRDWGYAPEYVEAMRLMLQQPEAGDYVIATGENHSIRELAQTAFAMVGLDAERYVRVDADRMRPADVAELRGDASKAARVLGWQPRTRFAGLVRIMLAADLRALGLDPERVMAPESGCR